MNRLKRKWYSGSGSDVRYCWDGQCIDGGVCSGARNPELTLGRMTERRNGLVGEVMNYDRVGRLTRRVQKVLNGALQGDYTYDHSYYVDDSPAKVSGYGGTASSQCYDEQGNVNWLAKGDKMAECVAGIVPAAVSLVGQVRARTPGSAPERLTRPEKLILLANAIFWLVFGGWFIQTIEPLPTNALELQDLVNYPVTRASHLPYEATRSSAVWRLTSAIQFPSIELSKRIVPTYRYDATFLGGTLLVWRLVLTVLLSFIQWFAFARMLGWLVRFVGDSKRQSISA